MLTNHADELPMDSRLKTSLQTALQDLATHMINKE